MRFLLSLCVLIGVIVGGCQPCGTRPEAQQAAPACGTLAANQVIRTYPYGDCNPCADCGVVKVEKLMPKQVNVGEPFEYNIIVTNLTGVELTDVVVTETMANDFQYAGSKPVARQDKQKLEWKEATLGPRASKTYTVSGAPGKPGELVNCTNAAYVYPGCATTLVLQPQLALTHTASDARVICEGIELALTVKNQGTGLANNVKIAAKLPDGLTAAGAKAVDINVGTLGAGETKTYPVKLKAAKTGDYTVKAVASADGGLSAQSLATTTKVTQPILAITKTGPATQFLGRSVEYTITVTNKGNSPAADTVVEDTLPADISDIRVTEGGVQEGALIRWKLGTLAAGASRTLKVAYLPAKDATFSNKATAKAYCAAEVSAAAQTVVKGIPALLLEVIDVEDPVEVGKTETYRITATNQGTAVATNITIKAALETDFMEYVSSSGATKGQPAGAVIAFEPLSNLAPRAKALWEVRVKAIKPGDVRFRVTMNSDQLGRDVEETESTNFYK